MFKTNNRKSPKNYWEMLIQEIKEPNLIAESSATYSTTRERRPIQYVLGEPFSDTYFTQREADCVFHLIHGKTMGETGKILELSPRTVEYYLGKIKRKLNCKKKNEIIDKVSQTQFVINFNNDPFNHK